MCITYAFFSLNVREQISHLNSFFNFRCFLSTCDVNPPLLKNISGHSEHKYCFKPLKEKKSFSFWVFLNPRMKSKSLIEYSLYRNLISLNLPITKGSSKFWKLLHCTTHSVNWKEQIFKNSFPNLLEHNGISRKVRMTHFLYTAISLRWSTHNLVLGC
jgi:hypothetical protein